jgi:hypothetical protein
VRQKIALNEFNVKDMKQIITVWMLLVAVLGANAALSQATGTPGDVRRDRYLLLDSRIIESTTNAALRLGSPRKDPQNPLFGENWESRFDNLYAKVIHDPEEKLYKCWYTVFVTSKLEDETSHENRGDVEWSTSSRQAGVCYAYSSDGVNWIKPELGLVECHGNKKNNLVFTSKHQVTVMQDLREKNPQKRYKAIEPSQKSSLIWFSPDGIHWKEQKIQGIDHGDTHNCVFWDESIEKYVLFTRAKDTQYGRPLYRQVSRAVSADFIRWEKAELVFQGRSTEEQFHDLTVFPHGGVYLGLIGIMDVDGSDRQWAELAWSTDSKSWHRIEPGKAFIPNGSVVGDYDWGCIFPGRPIFQENGILLYYGANNNRFFGWRDGFLARAFLRPDGFAGYEQEKATWWRPDQPEKIREQEKVKAGYVVTKRIPVTGQTVGVTADIAPGGYVVVRVMDASTGRKVAESNRLKKTATDEVLTWKWKEENFSLEKFNGKEVSFEFEFLSAKLFSFAFK